MSQLPVIAPTVLDRMIGYVSPARALSRYRERVQFEAAARFFGPGQYNGARANKPSLRNWWPRRGGPNSDSLPDRPALIARSADLERNEPLATGAISTTVTTTVGTGLRATANIDRHVLGLTAEAADEWERQADAYFEHWAESKAADVAGLLTFYQQQELVLRGQLVRGDVAAIRRFVERSGDLFATRLQLLEGDRISTPDGKLESVTMMDGVEMDRDGRHVRYHVLEEHPGDSCVRNWIPVDVYGAESGARRALLVARQLRIGQVRGIPILAPVIELLKQLGRYTEAELMAAVVTSFFTVFIKSEANDDAAGLPNMAPTDGSAQPTVVNPTDTRDIALGPGSIVGLQPGDEPVFPNAMRPNTAFDPFVLAILRQIGVALELPFEFLVKHFTASYSASRAALLEAWRAVESRRMWLVADFCQPVREWVLEEAVLRGYLKAPGFFENPLIRAAYCRADWNGPAMGQLNPVQEVTAAKIRVEEGFSTRAAETAKLTGGNWERNHAQRVKEERMRREAGLDRESTAERIATEPMAPAPAPLPPGKSDDDEEDRDAA